MPVLAILVALVACFAVVGCGDEEADDPGADVQVNERTEVVLDDPRGAITNVPPGPEALDDFEALQRAEGNASVPAIRGSAGLTIPEWISTVNADVATYWQRQFNRQSYRFRAPSEVIYDEPVQSECGLARNSFGPFYCTFDRTIYLPVRFFERQSERFGDAAVAVIVAHENGHHVQEQLGLFNRGLLTIQTELQADCLAGVWARTVYRRGLLERGDIGEILGLVESSGDPRDTPVDAPGAHGSSGLRQSFFDQGYESGRPAACPPPTRREIRDANE